MNLGLHQCTDVGCRLSAAEHSIHSLVITGRAVVAGIGEVEHRRCVAVQGRKSVPTILCDS